MNGELKTGLIQTDVVNEVSGTGGETNEPVVDEFNFTQEFGLN